MPRYRVRIAGKHYDAMADLVRKHRLNIAGHTGKKAGRNRYIVDAFAISTSSGDLKFGIFWKFFPPRFCCVPNDCCALGNGLQ